LPENEKIFQSFVRSAMKSRAGSILVQLRFDELEKEFTWLWLVKRTK
jgi:hypothetical protein